MLMWQTRVSYVHCAYITLVNTELGFRLFKLGISNFWLRVSDTRIAHLVGFCGVLPCFDSIRRCAPLIRFCGAIVSYDDELRSHGRFGGAIMWCGLEVVKGQRFHSVWGEHTSESNEGSTPPNGIEAGKRTTESNHGSNLLIRNPK